MTADEKGFLLAIKKNPDDTTARSAYADWLDEHERPYEAMLQRAKAGLSEVYFQLRRKSDGLFSTGQRSRPRTPIRWAAKGKMWRKLADLHSHMRGLWDSKTYSGTPWSDVEVVVVEVRITFSAALPIEMRKRQRGSTTQPTVVEPHVEETAEDE
jgi:uncharacterized protein (TIGR02996 family)